MSLPIGIYNCPNVGQFFQQRIIMKNIFNQKLSYDDLKKIIKEKKLNADEIELDDYYEEITYNYCLGDLRVSFEAGDNKDEIEINYIEVEEQNKGNGSKLFPQFLNDMQKIGYKKFHLFASYDEALFEKPDSLEGLPRLVNFYKKFNFTHEEAIIENGYQIDMYLEIK